MRFRRILVPLDGSPRAASVLRQLDREEPAEFILLRVAEPHLTPVPGVAAGLALCLTEPQRERAELEEAERYLAEACQTLGPTARSLAVSGHPAEEILRAAESLGVDLILMASHARGGPQRWLLGSVAESVLRRAPCPVLILPPRAQEGPH